MKNYRALFAGAALGVASVSASLPAHADSGLFLNSMLDTYEPHSIDPEYWHHQGFRSNSIVESGEYLGARAMEELYYKSRASTLGPGMMVFGQFVNMQFQTANAIMFGHEYAHFSLHDWYGIPTHYFYNHDTNEEYSFAESYLYSMIFGGPGGASATSSGSGTVYGDPAKRIRTTMAGVNWQMNYSEKWVQRNLAGDENHAYSWPGFFNNRLKTMMYTYGDTVESDAAVSGDMSKIAAHYEGRGYSDDALDEMLLYSAVGNLLSPTFWTLPSSVMQASPNNQFRMKDPYFQIGASDLRFTWDVPQYHNPDGMTMAPAFYLRSGPIVGGLQVEKAVIGDATDEFTVIVMNEFKDAKLSASYTVNPDLGGSHLEVSLGYNFTDNFGIEARHISSDGVTLRGDRNNHTGEDASMVGVNIRF
jgi:hypothetical protein